MHWVGPFGARSFSSDVGGGLVLNGGARLGFAAMAASRPEQRQGVEVALHYRSRNATDQFRAAIR